jgi:hypothetical protein
MTPLLIEELRSQPRFKKTLLRRERTKMLFPCHISQAFLKENNT